MSPEAINSLMVLSFGFSVAGVLATGYQLVTAQPPSFLILGDGARPKAVASVVFLVFAAPFIIMRNTVRGRRIEQRNFIPAMLSTVIAGFWSLMSGTVMVMALQALGLVQA
jgi:O-antigen/teichoic acid export membrane protein